MRSFVTWVVAVAALHLALPLRGAVQSNGGAAPPPPPEVKINEHSAAAATGAGISKETLEAVAKAIQAYGVAWDLGDEKRFREAITGTPAMVELAVASLHTERAERAASQLARERLGGPPGTTQPAQRDPYTRTGYHRRVLAEHVTITGDDTRVTIARPSRNDPSYVLEKSPQGWRVLVSQEELRGAPPEKAAEAFNEQRQAYEQLAKRITAGEFKAWPEYADATSAIRRKFREQLRADTPATSPATTAPAPR